MTWWSSTWSFRGLTIRRLRGASRARVQLAGPHADGFWTLSRIRVTGLDHGADDYLASLSRAELRARVRALGRRSVDDRPPADRGPRSGGSIRRRLGVRRADRQIRLTTREFALLETSPATPARSSPRTG